MESRDIVEVDAFTNDEERRDHRQHRKYVYDNVEGQKVFASKPGQVADGEKHEYAGNTRKIYDAGVEIFPRRQSRAKLTVAEPDYERQERKCAGVYEQIYRVIFEVCKKF